MFNKYTFITSSSWLLSNPFTNIIGKAASRTGEIASRINIIFIFIKLMGFISKYIFKQVIFVISILVTDPRNGFTDPWSNWGTKGKAPSTDLTLTTTIPNTNSIK